MCVTVGPASDEGPPQTAGCTDGRHSLSIQPVQGRHRQQGPPSLSQTRGQPHAAVNGELPQSPAGRRESAQHFLKLPKLPHYTRPPTPPPSPHTRTQQI